MPDHPCHKCDTPVIVPPHRWPPGERDVLGILCTRCYIPKNPTLGWLLSRAKNMKSFDNLKYSDLNNNSTRYTYLLNFLKIETIDGNTDDDGSFHPER